MYIYDIDAFIIFVTDFTHMDKETNNYVTIY